MGTEASAVAQAFAKIKPYIARSTSKERGSKDLKPVTRPEGESRLQGEI